MQHFSNICSKGQVYFFNFQPVTNNFIKYNKITTKKNGKANCVFLKRVQTQNYHRTAIKENSINVYSSLYSFHYGPVKSSQTDTRHWITLGTAPRMSCFLWMERNSVQREYMTWPRFYSSQLKPKYSKIPCPELSLFHQTILNSSPSYWN